ncbi:hypothetical protein DMENIID0001_047930 [Sergentomyia squamirostris]
MHMAVSCCPLLVLSTTRCLPQVRAVGKVLFAQQLDGKFHSFAPFVHICDDYDEFREQQIGIHMTHLVERGN